MVQATTPTFILTFPDSVDPSQFSKIVLTIEQNDVKIQKTESDLVIEGQTISVLLTQKETLSFKVGKAELQLNWLYGDNVRGCSDIMEITITRNLLQEIMK